MESLMFVLDRHLKQKLPGKISGWPSKKRQNPRINGISTFQKTSSFLFFYKNLSFSPDKRRKLGNFRRNTLIECNRNADVPS
jgi:hypothetical protein